MAVTVTSVSSTQVGRNSHFYDFRITGTGFVIGAVASFSGTGVTVLATTILSSTQLRVELTVSSSATLSARNVTVTNLDASNGTLASGLTVVELVCQFYQPLNYPRGRLVYDPRGQSKPILYETPPGAVWTLDRSTGVLTKYTGQFNPWIAGSYGPADVGPAGEFWWIGIEANNATTARQAQTKFEADTLAKIGSVVNGSGAFIYPIAGQVRVDRHSVHNYVWQLDQADSHSDHGNLFAWDGTTRILQYTLTHAMWDNQPTSGVRNRVWDLDSDSAGNLWCVSADDTNTYLLLWKVAPGGVLTLAANLTTEFAGNISQPMIRWYEADDRLVICSAAHIATYHTSDASLVSSATVPVPVLYAENYQSFHHTIDDISSLFIVKAGATGPFFYEIDMSTLLLKRTIDFAGVSGAVGIFYNGFTNAYNASQVFRPITALYDPHLGGCWCEDFYGGVLGFWKFGDLEVVPPEPEPPGTGPTGLFLLEHVDGII